jgi:hypothetical protein
VSLCGLCDREYHPTGLLSRWSTEWGWNIFCKIGTEILNVIKINLSFMFLKYTVKVPAYSALLYSFGTA